MAEARERLGGARALTRLALDQLRATVHEQTDWRGWYRGRPLLFLSLAFGLGLWLSRRR